MLGRKSGHGRDAAGLREISLGWPAVLANLKSLLETGSVAYETKA